MTRVFARGLARSLLWSFALGAGLGFLRARALYYPQNGLYRIALDHGLDTLASYLWVGLACGLASQGLHFADHRARRGSGSGRLPIRAAASTLVPAARVLGTYPLLLWMLFRDGDLLSLSSGFQWLAAAALFAIYAGSEWGRGRGRTEPAKEAAGWGGVLAVLLCLLSLIPLRARTAHGHGRQARLLPADGRGRRRSDRPASRSGCALSHSRGAAARR